ncbi:unnamed protein product, partial [Ectocarpus sp. 12 AP-2014]
GVLPSEGTARDRERGPVDTFAAGFTADTEHGRCQEAGDGHRSTAAEMGTCLRFCRPLHVSPCCRAPLVIGVQTKPGTLPQHPEGAGR